jgi:CheY-like chemotaxis protein
MPETALPNAPKEDLRICIVDDRPEIRDLIKLILLGRGYRFGLAGSAAQARDVAGELKPHLVLLDIHLPGGECGYDLCRELKANSTPAPVVILMSASSGKGVSEEARAAGADGFTSKPMTPTTVRNIVQLVEAWREYPDEPFPGFWSGSADQPG